MNSTPEVARLAQLLRQEVNSGQAVLTKSNWVEAQLGGNASLRVGVVAATGPDVWQYDTLRTTWTKQSTWVLGSKGWNLSS